MHRVDPQTTYGWLFRFLGRRRPAGALPKAALLGALLGTFLFGGSPAHDASAQSLPGDVLGQKKISHTSGGFTGLLPDGAAFGGAVVSLGDLDGNGITDIAVGAPATSTLSGSVWIVLRGRDGGAIAQREIREGLNGFSGSLGNNDRFGFALALLDDVNGDGIQDLAAGAPGTNDGGLNKGAVWILFLDTDGTVKGQQKISQLAGGATGFFPADGEWGHGLACLGDLDDDGRPELAVGLPRDPAGGTMGTGSMVGAVWVLSLDTDGTVYDQSKISSFSLGGALADSDHFGMSLAALGDVDGDGNDDLAVGSSLSQQVWILFLNAAGGVISHQVIAAGQGGLHPPFPTQGFGRGLAALGDVDADDVPDLVIGSGSSNFTGQAMVTLLNADGTVKLQNFVSEGFTGPLAALDRFGESVAPLGDDDGDGVMDLAIGAPGVDDGGFGRGAVWLLRMNASTWLDAFHALAGTNGPPALVGSGTLLPGDVSKLELTNALPGSMAWMIAGFDPRHEPFLGGVLVPSPDRIVGPFVVDLAGELTVGGPWPTGIPDGSELWFQAWVADAGGPQGFAASNGVSVRSPNTQN